MSADNVVFDSLVQMGIDPVKAREASLRYQSVDAAINWVFGAGESWEPEQDPYPRPPQHYSSNNPFRNSTNMDGGTVTVGPADEEPSFNSYSMRPERPLATYDSLPSRITLTPDAPESIDDANDEDLQRALELSRQDTAGEVGGIESRDDRERSIRASAPPPSPRRTEDEDGREMDTFFGPSNKEDPEGKLALVSALNIDPSGNHQSNSNKEEEDFQRAIQESMMTASFHSVTPPGEVLPARAPRQAGVPVLYATSSELSYAANILQALAAVPQLREVFQSLGTFPEDPRALVILQNLLVHTQDYCSDNYALVDDEVKELQETFGIPHSVATALPPHAAIYDHWLPNIVELLMHTALARPSLVAFEDSVADFNKNPEQLMQTRLHQSYSPARTHVEFERTLSGPSDIHAALMEALWKDSTPGESIDALADIIFVHLKRTPGIQVKKWTLEEFVVLDRYLHRNLPWVTLIRAQQAVVQGERRRLREQIENLTTYRGDDISAAIKVLTKHLETTPTVPLSEARQQSRSQLKQQLERVGAAISDKISALEAQLEELGNDKNAPTFNTEDQDKRRERYELRAVLWHDGFMTPGRHLYSYVKYRDLWWKIEGADVAEVSWEDMEQDTTGQFTDGGPYLLIYAREGPRSEPFNPNPSAGGSAAGTLGYGSMSDTAAFTSDTFEGDSVRESGVGTVDSDSVRESGAPDVGMDVDADGDSVNAKVPDEDVEMDAPAPVAPPAPTGADTTMEPDHPSESTTTASPTAALTDRAM